MNFWDQFFSQPAYKYGTEPNAFLAAQVARLPAGGRVLVPGDGEGRNGVWLAQQGFQVLSVDGSAVALGKARQLADARGVTMGTEQADLSGWTPAPASADGVVLTYVHLPPAVRRPVHRRLAEALRPGGCLILEAFHPRQIPLTSGGPKDEAMLYTLERLRDDMGDLLLEEWAEEVETVLQEGSGHQGPAWVTRWIGQRR